jgi:hypothetical protein
MKFVAVDYDVLTEHCGQMRVVATYNSRMKARVGAAFLNLLWSETKCTNS